MKLITAACRDARLYSTVLRPANSPGQKPSWRQSDIGDRGRTSPRRRPQCCELSHQVIKVWWNVVQDIIDTAGVKTCAKGGHFEHSM